MQRHDVHALVGLLISSWQYLSRFLWQHSPAQFMNAYMVAVISTAMYAAALGIPTLVYANAALGLWLFSSSWLLPRLANATLWNNVLVSVAMVILAAFPNLLRRVRAGR